MNAQTETTVLANLSRNLYDRLLAETNKCKSDEMFQSQELSPKVFQARAYSRFINVLLDEIKETNKAMLFTTEKHLNP
tara:strand:- start:129 stop:362 length:234 start_codon:yes stop_codon:yes gene_type:complete